ncbi:hypothetical protein PR048_015921 [Dryococelus australis]|uniref:Uncharacterized protein n=1 Tax=Dryococelus australis TaxID=614101 RepID=A0ABQ9HIM0_9NEOP|nr:hypothetical protein PR048_015921 [Dryococelus australis]
MKPEVIGNVATLDLQKKANILPENKIELGVNERDVLEFRQDCCNDMIVLCEKLLEQSPLKYKLTKGISCFDPAIAKQPAIRNARLSTTLSTFVEHNWISVCDSDVFTEAVKSVRTMDRLHHFWMQNILSGFPDVQELPKFLKMIFIISHGNEVLKRCFSINKENLVENLRKQSLVGLVTVRGGIESVVVTKKLIHSARNAHARYVEVLEKQSTEAAVKLTAENEKKQLTMMLKELNEKKKIMDTAHETVAAINDRIKEILKLVREFQTTVRVDTLNKCIPHFRVTLQFHIPPVDIPSPQSYARL